MHKCYCIVPHTTEPCILAHRASLPLIELEIGWPPAQVGEIARTANKQFGFRATVLRHIWAGEDAHVCVLENHTPWWEPAEDCQWVGRGELDRLRFADSRHRTAIDAWFADAEEGRVPETRSAWEKEGWFDDAEAWIHSQLRRIGLATRGPVEQVKAASGVSCVLHVATTSGSLYFKADNPEPPFERSAIRLLEDRWPGNVPEVVAADTDRRWMLMRDFGDRYLEGMPDCCWADAARLFAEIQIDCVSDLSRWTKIGCLDLRLDQLAAHGDLFLPGVNGRIPGVSDELSQAEIADLRAALPRFREKCAELADYGVPHTAVQQDFSPYNVVATDSGYLFFDWSYTAITHPFFGINMFFEFLGVDRRDWRFEHVTDGRALCMLDAYLEPWEIYEPRDRLLEAFRISRQLNPLYISIWANFDLQYLEPTSPYAGFVRGIVTQLLRDTPHILVSSRR